MEKKSLIARYPRIFRQYKLPMTQTAMCWGIECGEGWGNLLDLLCSQLQWDIDKNSYPQIEATQVKEKYGTLKFYYSYAEDAITEGKEREMGVQDGVIRFAEACSGYICEICGTNQDVFQTKGWIATICKNCEAERSKKNVTK